TSAMIEAALAARAARGAPAAPAAALAAAERLDSLLRAGEFGIALTAGPLVLERLRETLGDARDALAALRRRPYLYARQPYLGAVLREEARLAARLGDRPGAARAARHYAALRSGAERAIRDQSPG
ncbi:hypothetical protein, partial [Roseisolibacter sp. H3M3-2]|uniref:hypothetical protein n=1 Tax=Roseisolibacter sp. H3M3-2 TaxID=3031323 RepID=UPI0023DBC55F